MTGPHEKDTKLIWVKVPKMNSATFLADDDTPRFYLYGVIWRE